VSKSEEVLRVLGRYLIEIVERHELCPWARPARERGELAASVLWGSPAIDDWFGEANRLLSRPTVRVAIIVAPELAVSRAAFTAVRDQVASQIPSAGVAEFHPVAALDLAAPARLVPFLRRSPDPLLQLVPLALIDAVRGAPPAAGLAQQAAMLGGHAGAPPLDVAARIAATNHATVARAHAEIAATLDDIAADRRAAYARLGIRARRPGRRD
jgi:hypothetical protein